MFTFKSTLVFISITVVLSSISIRRAGWLDRVVEYQKKLFIDDFMKKSSKKFTARIEKPPHDYVDSKDWDYESVVRLLSLIRDSEGAAPVRSAFRRAMKTRRFMSFAETFKAFPSLIKDHPNDFHYEVDSGEYYADVGQPKQYEVLQASDIIVVSNPVEARLPSASITIALLRSILEKRAQAGRVMPSTTITISWPVTTRTSSLDKQATLNTNSTSSSATAASVTIADVLQNDTSTVSGNVSSVNTTAGNQTML